MSKHHRCDRIIPVVILLFLLLAGRLQAQSNDLPPYKGFVPYDPHKFTMGAITIFDADMAIDVLGLEYTWLYHAHRSVAGILNSPDLGKGGYDSIKAQRTADIWKGYLRRNFKVTFEPNGISGLTSSAWTTMTFAGISNPRLHGWTFEHTASKEDSVAYPREYIPTLGIWGVYVPEQSGTPTPKMIVGASRGTQDGLSRHDGYWKVLKENDVDIDEIDSLKIDLGLTMKVYDDVTLQPEDTVAFVPLFRRDTAGQFDRTNQSCRCRFYTPFDTLYITYADVLSGTNVDDKYEFVEVKKTFEFPKRDTVTSAITVSSIPIYNNNTLVHDNIPNNGTGGWFGWGYDSTDNSECIQRCDDLLSALKVKKILGSTTFQRGWAVENADFYYDVYSTRRVALTFLSGRVSPHLVSKIQDGTLDEFIHREIAPLYDDEYEYSPPASPTAKNPTDSVVFRYGITGESQLKSYYPERLLSSKVQRYMEQRSDIDTSIKMRQMYNNMIRDENTYRMLMGDLDTTDIRMMHMCATQSYHFGATIPIRYANVDSMEATSTIRFYRTFYNPSGSTDAEKGKDHLDGDGNRAYVRWIMGNSLGDYEHYITQRKISFDSSRSQFAVAVDAARRRYRDVRDAPYPVWAAIQVQGYLGQADAAGNWFLNDWRPTTPEEIKGQSWLALNAGVDGIYFSDFVYDGREFGVMHAVTGDTTTEYASLFPDPQEPEPWKTAHTLPKMWLGFGSRFDAVREIAQEFRDTILPVYNKLDRNGYHFAVDRIGTYDTVPMLDTVLAERAARYPGFAPFTGTTPTTYDPPDKAYIDVTVFRPGAALAREEGEHVRYLLFTNLRTWPIDMVHYNDTVKTFYSNVATFYPSTFQDSGLGNIDVRRPVVRFKSTHVSSDSVIVRRVGREDYQVVPANVYVELDWLEPGEGALYRVEPVIDPVSAHGTAYNNGVHMENPTRDTIVTLPDGNGGTYQQTVTVLRDRLIVYERDSSVYLRALNMNRGWSEEHLISDESDQDIYSAGFFTVRYASNMYPTIATARNGTSCMIVWERRDNFTNKATVEARWLPSLPTFNTFPSLTRRLRLMGSRSMNHSWQVLTPAVVGIDSGYVVAWAAPDYTTEVMAVRDNPGDDSGNDYGNDTSTVVRVYKPSELTDPRDSATGYPTLAYVRNYGSSRVDRGWRSARSDEFDKWPKYIEPGLHGASVFEENHTLHLAYQQGSRMNRNWEIMYNRLGARFGTDGGTELPEVWFDSTEVVSHNLPECDLVYPSIAADSTRVGVAFTGLWAKEHVVLRFRSDLSNVPRDRRWRTTTYRWGGSRTTGTNVQKFDFRRPSLTMFPRRPLKPGMNYFGALTWEWTSAPDNRRNGIKLYRLGDRWVDSLADGRDPSMALAPYVWKSPEAMMGATSVFHRGSDSSRLLMFLPPDNDLGVFYPAFVKNTDAERLEQFRAVKRPTLIYGYADVVPYGAGRRCDNPPLPGGFNIRVVTHPNQPPTRNNTPPYNPGYSPFFFSSLQADVPAPMTIEDAWEHLRTDVFTVGDTSLRIIRTALGHDNVIGWLNTQPVVPGSGAPANIHVATQVVRASDSVVLWTGDTVSARGIGDDTLRQVLEVPVHQVAAPGTEVFVRVVAVPTPGMAYNVSAGFHFAEQEGGAGSGVVVPRTISEPEDRPLPGPLSAIRIDVVPNPLRGDGGELHVVVPMAGTAVVEVYDLFGRRVIEPVSVTIDRPGAYAIPLDLSGLSHGAYTVRVDLDGVQGITRFTVTR